MPVYKATSSGVIELTEQELEDWKEIDRLAIKNAPIKKAEECRIIRDKLLSDSDWTQVADAPVDQKAWAAYRQALRDLPSQEEFPNEVTWPTEPVEAVSEEVISEEAVSEEVVEVVAEEPVEEVASVDA